jgi:hypothetical protein
MPGLPRALAVATLLLSFPAALFAQASIAGTVQDASGAVLPGVTVEATSPELIEKVRTATTDSTGQYRIENLRPGIYAVTFTLPGFSTVKREGIELTGSFTATVNTELKVGAIEETIVVTGETPIVDVQNARQQTVVGKDVIAALPTTGGYSSLLALVPGIVGGTRDVQTARVHARSAHTARCWPDARTAKAARSWTACSSPCPRAARRTTSPIPETRRNCPSPCLAVSAKWKRAGRC